MPPTKDLSQSIGKCSISHVLHPMIRYDTEGSIVHGCDEEGLEHREIKEQDAPDG